jgi:RNA recognition motif-containing protein
VIVMGKRLYVGNLSFDASEAALTAAFEKDGRRVSSVSIVTDRDTGRPRGFAFVEMASEADAQGAIKALDGAEIGGRAVRVSEAEERKSRPGGGDSDRRGGGRRGW